MEQHTHGPDGRVIFDAPADVEPAAAEVEAVEEVADAEVRIAEINAKRDVELAKLSVKAEEVEDQCELEQLRGEVRALREIVDMIRPPEPTPEPAPEPIVVEAPAEEETLPAPEPVEESAPPTEKKSRGFWGPGYR